ncbi:MAG TPA: CotH kinase family protein [Solirubrobacterales bacterium]
MYEPGTVVVIDLTLSSAERAKLEAEPDKYVKGTFSLSKTDGTPGGAETPVVTARPVEIRLKGNVLGSFRTLDGKAGFKFKFAKSEPFLGLRKMTLNNMVEDPSFIHETLAYRVFRGAGIAAPRTGFADVRLNGEDFGTHLNLENLDKVNLERWFGKFEEPPQHLYEGEYGVDVTPGVAALTGQEGGYEVDEGKEEHVEDLEALTAAVNSTKGPGWSAAVGSVADLAEMTRMWAVEKYIGHWDGYSGEEGLRKPNNYYLYSDPAGRFQMLPWGTDNTWEPYRRTEFDADAGLLFDDCLADPACASLYRQALRELQKTIPGLGLDSLAAKTAALLKPWEEQEQGNGRSEHDLAEIKTGVDETREFIAERPGELAAFLGPEESSASVPAPGPSAGAPAVTTPSLYVGHSRRGGAALVTHLWFAGPGAVIQTAKVKTAHGWRKACSVRSTVSSVGGRDLRCRLSGSVLSRLHSHSVLLRLRTTFVPQSGPGESAVRRVRLPRKIH